MSNFPSLQPAMTVLVDPLTHRLEDDVLMETKCRQREVEPLLPSYSCYHDKISYATPVPQG